MLPIFIVPFQQFYMRSFFKFVFVYTCQAIIVYFAISFSLIVKICFSSSSLSFHSLSRSFFLLYLDDSCACRVLFHDIIINVNGKRKTAFILALSFWQSFYVFQIFFIVTLPNDDVHSRCGTFAPTRKIRWFFFVDYLFAHIIHLLNAHCKLLTLIRILLKALMVLCIF